MFENYPPFGKSKSVMDVEVIGGSLELVELGRIYLQPARDRRTLMLLLESFEP